MMKSVAFLGLGAMGYRMASHLPKQFQDVRVWNRTTAKAQQHAEQYQTQAVDLATAFQADVIFSCLPTSLEVYHLMLQAEEHGWLKTGSIWVDCTSGVPAYAKAMSENLKTYGVDFLDAPVSGQTIGAENGTLTVMVGGQAEAFERVYPAMQCFGKLIQHVGESGAGFAVKAVNNMLMAVNICAVAEGLGTLKAHGVDLNSALTCINASSGKSMVTETVFPQRVLNRAFPLTFALPLLDKDTGIALDLAQQQKLATPVLSTVRNLVNIANSQSTANDDFSTIAKMYEQWHKSTLE
ncbi:NAD(P)-dependent oxidoreductase [Moraxella sp. ZY210820]|uniref:NAD(P)-dependent oxidoreductase n=1 Tax=unclassified Moraxella TaxID=2685852 RepID=UPI00272F8C16|nr:NAD(P)-dependent oxidoreductase [Moraxella sp. ZY210820]WLF85061.1 NAD(P)-dependent oxidoreductase [Moraxella sp. ZY210820]